MEDDDNNNSSNQSNVDGDQLPLVQQVVRTNISRKRKQSAWYWYDIRNFPDSLLIEILARLPLKSIFRFKHVCNHWHTLISHPSFSRFYFSILNSKAASSPLPFRILHRHIRVSNFKDLRNRLLPDIYNSSELSVILFSIEKQPKHENFRVLAMSNGLILCLLWSTPSVCFVCDPLTQQWITLPKSKSKCQAFFGEGLITKVNQDNMLTGYTVVRIACFEVPMNYLNIEMFASESSEWVSYNLPCVTPTRLLKRFSSSPIHFHNAFHWLVLNHGMIAFDPCKDPKSLSLIPFPNDRDVESELLQDGGFQICGECQGTLRYFEVAHNRTKLYFLTMWSMKDYEKGEWCCEFKVRRSDLHSSDVVLSKWLLKGTFLPLMFHPLNGNVVYLKCIELGWIVSYNVLNRSLDVACKQIGVIKEHSWRAVIPFVLPRWPMLVPVASQPSVYGL